MEEGGSYEFLGVLLENVRQEDRTVFFKMQRSCTCKGYLLTGLARCETIIELLRPPSMILITSSTVFHVDPDWIEKCVKLSLERERWKSPAGIDSTTLHFNKERWKRP